MTEVAKTIKIERLVESKLNPRKEYNKQELADLMAEGEKRMNDESTQLIEKIQARIIVLQQWEIELRRARKLSRQRLCQKRKAIKSICEKCWRTASPGRSLCIMHRIKDRLRYQQKKEVRE